MTLRYHAVMIKPWWKCGVIAAVLATSGRSAGQEKADVVVYGATPGGFCAAIAAAREGASVVLLEPTGHIGGVNTGGLSFSDSNQTVRRTVMGLFDEWHTRVEKDYNDRGVALPYKVNVKGHTAWTYEPHVAMRVTLAMLDEAKVKVLPKHVLKSVAKEEGKIIRLETSAGDFEAKTFVDATYEGDLMAAAGVSWTIGREGKAEYGESLAGKQYPKGKVTVSGLDENGKPLPFITTTDGGDPDAGDKNVMVYSFRLCVTDQPENRVPFPKPKSYDPAKFEFARRYYKAYPNAPFPWDLYELPGKKFDANNGIGKQFSMGLVGGCNGWSEGDQATRDRMWEEHKQYTLEQYHFFATDPAIPEPIRTKMASLGLCEDEFPEYGHWSPQLYVREGRRMKGMFVLTQKDILTDPSKEDPIVVSSFPIDSHDCQRIGTAESVVNEGTIFPVRMTRLSHGFPYHVPYRSILPKPEECTNLVVPVALSTTHVGISSIRVEPTWMILGQSAGIAAALAAKDGVTVQKLPYEKLRGRLLAAGQVLDLPTIEPAPELPPTLKPESLPGIVLDDPKGELTGPWESSSNFRPHVGSGYRFLKAGSKGNATFKTKVTKSGKYQVRFAYSPHQTRAKDVPVRVTQGANTKTFVCDQTKPLPANEFARPIGDITLEADQEVAIAIDVNEADGFVILDALQLLEVK
jgi:hypothetical protein